MAKKKVGRHRTSRRKAQQRDEGDWRPAPELRELFYQDYRDVLLLAADRARSLLKDGGSVESTKGFCGATAALLLMGVPREGILAEQQTRVWEDMLIRAKQLLDAMNAEEQQGAMRIVEAGLKAKAAAASQGREERLQRILGAFDERLEDGLRRQREHFKTLVIPRVKEDILPTWENILNMMVPGKDQEGDNSTSSGRRRRGRPPKYTPEFVRLLDATYNEYRAQGMDAKQAWYKTAEIHGLKSGDAAKMACLRHR